jgi:hypothetical protein
MDRHQDRSAIGGQPKAEYGQAKGRVFEQAQNFRNVVVIGDDGSGEPRILSSFDETETSAWLNKAHSLEPTG